MKPFADDKINVTQKLKFVLGRVENIVGKGENAGNQHFLLFAHKVSSTGSLQSGSCGKGFSKHLAGQGFNPLPDDKF